jgi:hypothetical protein
MPIIISHQGMLGDLWDDIARLENLTADLKKVADGKLPPIRVLDESPMLHNWRLSSIPVPRLEGECRNHPLLNGPIIRTSDIWIMAPDLGWARTLSRFYRLGKPADDGA